MKKTKTILISLALTLFAFNSNIYATQIISPWAQTPFKVMKERGLIPETLREDENMREEITREEFAELVTTYFIQFKPQTIEGEEVFTDTLSPIVQLAGRIGIVKGTGEGKFRPYEKLTREQASTMFMRVEKMIDESIEITRENSFKDKEEISEWAKEGVSTMSKEGVIKGYPDGRFRPKKAMTKEEGIVVVARMAKKHGIITFEEGGKEGEEQPTKPVEEGKVSEIKPVEEVMKNYPSEHRYYKQIKELASNGLRVTNTLTPNVKLGNAIIKDIKMSGYENGYWSTTKLEINMVDDGTTLYQVYLLKKDGTYADTDALLGTNSTKLVVEAGYCRQQDVKAIFIIEPDDTKEGIVINLDN
ncbi:S-layer homology domain-containing protein [Tepidibacter thalassicus]|uniref:S-layer homology domain-containing protein n=1 Tax=Tepidibacter thalassicus DSM 15285 TaxID=1123350 RepID=A0A1M5SVL6_9FIRM|nr:S-layer homology domain-containing protein [Tepidibacter thalassicus]SHH42500.1 S-layer homology domain-containing protein [Tepidibacter thalassicus DSM 15285]